MDMIVAVDLQGGIARDGEIPWHFPEELEHFVNITQDSVVIMGRKTWESIPEKYRPLKNRTNIIVSARGTVKTEHGSHYVCHDADDAKELADTIANDCGQSSVYPRAGVWCIGGKKLYEYYLNGGYICRLVKTTIKHKYNCDTFLSELPSWLEKNLLMENNDFKIEEIWL